MMYEMTQFQTVTLRADNLGRTQSYNIRAVVNRFEVVRLQVAFPMNNNCRILKIKL